MDKARQRAKVPLLLVHDLRRTAMRISGPKSRSIFDRYDITDERAALCRREKTSEKKRAHFLRAATIWIPSTVMMLICPATRCSPRQTHVQAVGDFRELRDGLGTERPRIVPKDFDAERRSARSPCRALARPELRIPPNPAGRHLLLRRDPCGPTERRGTSWPGARSVSRSASESSRPRRGASTLE